MPVPFALDELSDNSGSQFDPNVVDAMLDLASGVQLRPVRASSLTT
jgi:HD-GYP domain-containing protein (c-di-GMP phosphodiesterase class II)